MSRGGPKRSAAVLAAALTLAATATAAAKPGDTTLTGSTTEGVDVKLNVGPSGNATAFKIERTKVACAEGGTLTNRGGTYTEFDTSDPGAFEDKRRTSSDDGAHHFETKSVIRGEGKADDHSWSGIFKLITRVFERGERIDVCKLKTTWSVR